MSDALLAFLLREITAFDSTRIAAACGEVNLHLKALLDLGEDGKLPHGHLAQVQGDLGLAHGVIDRDEVIPQQPELVEVDGRVVCHGLKVRVQVVLHLRSQTDLSLPAAVEWQSESARRMDCCCSGHPPSGEPHQAASDHPNVCCMSVRSMRAWAGTWVLTWSGTALAG